MEAPMIRHPGQKCQPNLEKKNKIFRQESSREQYTIVEDLFLKGSQQCVEL